MEQIKQNIFYILAIIGTSCGAMAATIWNLILGTRYGDLFTIWCSVIGIGLTVVGFVIWTINLAIEAKKYFTLKGGDGNVEGNS